MTTATAPWTNPPQRKKKLADRKAERLARRAQFWGDRLAQAAEVGPDAVAAVAWDRTRATLDKLPGEARDRAYRVLAEAVDRVRETHAA